VFRFVFFIISFLFVGETTAPLSSAAVMRPVAVKDTPLGQAAAAGDTLSPPLLANPIATSSPARRYLRDSVTGTDVKVQ